MWWSWPVWNFHSLWNMIKTPIVEFCNEKHIRLYMHFYNNFTDRAELHAGTTKMLFLSQPCLCVVHNDKERSHIIVHRWCLWYKGTAHFVTTELNRTVLMVTKWAIQNQYQQTKVKTVWWARRLLFCKILTIDWTLILNYLPRLPAIRRQIHKKRKPEKPSEAGAVLRLARAPRSAAASANLSAAAEDRAHTATHGGTLTNAAPASRTLPSPNKMPFLLQSLLASSGFLLGVWPTTTRACGWNRCGFRREQRFSGKGVGAAHVCAASLYWSKSARSSN